jgi:flagellar hook-associated protein 3 FlgL
VRVDPNYLSNLSSSINQGTLTEQTLTQELSSGLDVSSLSDNPVAMGQDTLLSSSLANIDTFVQTAASEQGTLQVADTTLGSVVTALTSAISLATTGANGTQNASENTAMGQQVSGLLNQVIALANTSYQGQHLFSGSQGSVAPFALNSTTNPATVTYNGDSQTQTIATPNGQQVPVNVPGSAIFTSAFSALTQLVSDLNANNGTGIAADSTALSAALTTVGQQRSVLDSSLTQLNSSSTYSQTQAANITAQQSTLLSANPAQVATALSNSEVQQKALYSTIAALETTNLFDYLKG